MKYSVLLVFLILLGFMTHAYANNSKQNLEETVRVLQSMLLDEKEYLFQKNKECARLLNNMYRDLHSELSDYYEFKPQIQTTYFSDQKNACMYEFELETEEGTTIYVANYFSKIIEQK